MSRSLKRPVTLVTGFLGSGKTTLLSRLLADPAMRNTAVLVNEFGEVGLDHHLLRRVNERTVLLGNGCICCARREELAESLSELLAAESRASGVRVDRVVIETSGLADPAPVLYTVFSDPVLQHHFDVESVVTTVDAVNGPLHLDHSPEAIRQVAAADVICTTKTDLARESGVTDLNARLKTLNPSARLHGLSPETTAEEVAAVFRPDRASPRPSTEPEPNMPGGHSAPESQGEAGTGSLSLTFDGPVEWAAFGAWLSMLLHARGEQVLRVKGLLDVGEAGPVVLDGVQHIIHPPRHLERWPDADQGTRIIFITRGVRPEALLASLRTHATLLGANPRSLYAGSGSSAARMKYMPGSYETR